MLSLEDAIAIEGGPVELDSPLPGIPAGALHDAWGTLNFLTNVFGSNLEPRGEGVWVVLTRSAGLSCRVRPVSEGGHVILVPAGLIGRLRTLCRTLLRYWGKERRVLVGNSPLDRIPEDQWQVPPKLAPLFDAQLSGDEFWQSLGELDASLDLDPAFEPDVGELMHLGLVYLLCHEFAHVFFRHFEFVAAVAQSRPQDVARMRRAIELHADSFAGTWAITIFLAQLEPGADVASVSRGILRQSYVVTLLMAMFDAQKKFVGFYDEGDYNHPLIRREVFSDACEREVGLKGKDFLEFWKEIEMTGWQRAVHAMGDLNLEAMEGKFGAIEKGKLAYPLQALNYGFGASFPALAKILEQCFALLEEVKGQLAEFDRASSPKAARSGR